ncbi:cytochrome o ubiquinol oxidase subunit III [Dyella choica]|uniref:Cytochrome bo(3) ubiquinol oxidase subunit 3 n=1 Tax=Dyella choica TaxID=1927959 RepID=A0A432M808_9GAMM|nr:cytochrome o ubiquinol oxidase subunit III [Dyella choica]RUL77585.1 cytochrome o ubiquinol oxidase subunit III [Dyella choica]
MSNPSLSATHDSAHHDASSQTTAGFWVYLMSDCLIFAVLFATFGVLVGNTADGPAGRDIFSLPYVAGETALLLLSSFTFGAGMLSARAGRRGPLLAWLVTTALLGAAFVGMELHEFAALVHDGAGPGVSAFLSAYFTLVGTHGLHVTLGILWLGVMLHQAWHYGLDEVVLRRLACLSMFWHFLDLIWICVFTFVYLRAFL